MLWHDTHAATLHMKEHVKGGKTMRTALIFLPLFRPCIMSPAVNLRTDSESGRTESVNCSGTLGSRPFRCETAQAYWARDMAQQVAGGGGARLTARR